MTEWEQYNKLDGLDDEVVGGWRECKLMGKKCAVINNIFGLHIPKMGDKDNGGKEASGTSPGII